MTSEITTKERGWPGHYICADRCQFRRNTLVSCQTKSQGLIQVVVSTVGAYRDRDGKIQTIGCERYYETMAFKAVLERGYIEADIVKQLDIKRKWCIGKLHDTVDNDANDMHDDVVAEVVENLRANPFYYGHDI